MPKVIDAQEALQNLQNLQLERINAATAQKYLTSGGKNRYLEKARVRRLAEMMVEGPWVPYESIIKFSFDDAGKEELIDGFHRLNAVSEADKLQPGIEVEMLVGRGYPSEARLIADSGKSRTFADAIAIQGYNNASPTGAATKLLWAFKQGTWPDIFQRGSIPQLFECLRGNPSIHESIRIGYAVSKKHLLQPSHAAFLYYLFKRADAELADEFFEFLISGENLQKGNAIYALRERLQDNANATAKLPPKYLWALVIKGWNAYFCGENVRQIRWPASNAERFPVVSGLPIPLEDEIDHSQAA